MRPVKAGLGGHDAGVSGGCQGGLKHIAPSWKQGRMLRSDCTAFNGLSETRNENITDDKDIACLLRCNETVNCCGNAYNKDGEDNHKWAVSLYPFTIISLSEAMLSKNDTEWTTIDGAASLKTEFHCYFIVRLHEITEGVCKNFSSLFEHLEGMFQMPLSTSAPSSPMISTALS